MYTYKPVKEGMIVAKVDGVRYKCALNHPTLPNTIEVPKEVPNAKELGLELIDEKKRITRGG